MRVLSFPFRFTPTGSAATVEQDSDGCYAEQLALLVQTQQGERPLTPGFGITDPAFGEVDTAQIAAAASEFVPDVTVTSVTIDGRDDALTDVTVSFDVPRELG